MPWVEQHTHVQGLTMPNNAAVRTYVANELAIGGFGLPITAVGAKRLVVGAPPWGGAAGAPLPGGGVQPRMFLLGIDAGTVALEHISRRFPDVFIGNGPPLLVRQQAACMVVKLPGNEISGSVITGNYHYSSLSVTVSSC